MNKFSILLIAALVFASFQSCKSKQENTQPASIDELFDAYYEGLLKLDPIAATSFGDNRYNDTLPNYLTQSYRNQQNEFYSYFKSQLSGYDKSTLTADQQMSYEILGWECDINVERLKYPFYLTPIDQFWSFNLSVGQLAAGTGVQPFKTVEDYDNWTKRVDDYMAWCDTAIANMRQGMALNYTLPKSLIVKVLPQMEAFAHGPVEEHLFYNPVLLMPDSFTDVEKKGIKNVYFSMVKDKVIPKYKELYSFMKDEYLPAGRESSGITSLPHAKEMYDYAIKSNTTTNMSADEIFNLGLSEVERLTAEMEVIKDSVGFTGDLKSFFVHLRNKKELMPYSDPQQVIGFYNSIYEKMKPNLKALFDKTPKTSFEVRRVEAFREKSVSAQYNPGSPDGSRPGIFYVPIPDVKHYNILSSEDLFLHEAIPGHHYQMSLQLENSKLPDFRKIYWNSAYGEGWALYCESLGKELGLYDDPYQYFGMLSEEMHRAIRLVVDAGLHAKGWTREQSIQYSLDHEAASESEITSEIERYMANPGQALSYKIGQLKIIELRKRAELELGDKFNIKMFHDIVLEDGSLPLSLLEAKVNLWISETAMHTTKAV